VNSTTNYLALVWCQLFSTLSKSAAALPGCWSTKMKATVVVEHAREYCPVQYGNSTDVRLQTDNVEGGLATEFMHENDAEPICKHCKGLKRHHGVTCDTAGRVHNL
jgi:hypothetical protein